MRISVFCGGTRTQKKQTPAETGISADTFSRSVLSHCMAFPAGFNAIKVHEIPVPLTAIVHGKTITGPDLSGEDWADLKRRHRKGLAITMACCGAPGHLRTSKNGVQHFYHEVAAGCQYAEESREHLEIKYTIYRICQSEHWETYVEYPAPDRSWIADVYATRGNRNIVFEIQISPISPVELEERDRKYRHEGIESYWLLDNFLGRARDFAAGYQAHLFGEEKRHGGAVPYIDESLFTTGPENHIFIPKGIRSIGLSAKKQTLFSTNNPEIPLEVWVKEVLKGNYQRYLEETAGAYHRKQRLVTMAAPALIRFRDFYLKIVRQETFRERLGQCSRRVKTAAVLKHDRGCAKKFQEIESEIGWLENEYRSYISENYGLFSWKKIAGSDTPRLFFRLDSEANVKKLQECAAIMARWEESFMTALTVLEQEISRK